MSAAEVRVIGRYALYGEIAAGGMASVHLGRLLGPVGFSRTVAIKRLHPSFARDPEFVSMFLDEARLAARIRHPNAVPTLDVVATHGELFLVMEYVQGESLSALVRALRPTAARVPVRVALSILAGALQGLHAAHEARDERGMSLGLVHRDVSPQNILVGTDGMARVFDFGIAKAAGRAHNTREGVLKGKLAYMAPEQVAQEPVDRAADVYAASIVLWELLTGTRLFHACTEAELLVHVLSLDIPPPSSVVPDLPAELDAIVMRGLARAPKNRFPTAREMALALDRCGSASLGEVAEWLESVAGPTLAKRAHQVGEVEMQSPTSSGALPAIDQGHALSPETPAVPIDPAPASAGSIMTTVTPAEPVQAPRRRPMQAPMLALLLAGAALGGATIAVSVVRGHAAPTATPAPLSAAPTANPSSTAGASASAPDTMASSPALSSASNPALSSASSPTGSSPPASAASQRRTARPPPGRATATPPTPRSPFDLGGRE